MRLIYGLLVLLLVLAPAADAGMAKRHISAVGGQTVGAPTPYTAIAVDFDGGGDYLTRGAEITGQVDGKAGTFSVWIRTDGDSATGMIYGNGTTGTTHGSQIYVTGDPKTYNANARNSAGTVNLNLASNTTYADAGWHHLLVSYDLSVPVAYLYVDDVEDEAGGSTETDDTIDETRGNAAVAAKTNGSNDFNGCMADLWWNNTFLDISIQLNRRKFIDGEGKPVDLGSDGSTPISAVPVVFFSGATASWHTNDGDGGGFTEQGAIADCSDSPSD